MLVSLDKNQIFKIVECMDIAYKEGFNMDLKLAIKLLNEVIRDGLEPQEVRYAIAKMNEYASDLEPTEI